jgi:hypothetical protein
MISVAYDVTGRNVLEICETGEQGGLIVGSESLVKLKSPNASLGCNQIFNFLR